MNILFCDHLKVRSLGTESVHIYEVVSNLSKLGHNVVLINAGHPRNEAEIDVSLKSLWTRIKRSLIQSRIAKPLRGEILILWTFFRELHIFFSAFFIMVRRKTQFDVIYRRHSLLNTEYLLAKLFKIPSIKEVNGILADEGKIAKKGDNISLRIMDRTERFNMPKADKIIVVTSTLKEILQKDYGVPGDKIVVIPNGANTDLFKPMDATKAREELGLSLSDSYVCFVGNLWQAQGVEYLIRAAPLILESYPNTQFLIVGDGQMRTELIELAKQTGVSDKVIFTGMVPYQKVPLYINASSVCVVPEARDERNDRSGASSMKTYEYMACGKPVVTGNVEGHRELILESNAGYVVRTEELAELAGAITRVLKDRQLSDKLGENGRRAIIKNHSWASVSEKVAEVCQSAIK